MRRLLEIVLIGLLAFLFSCSTKNRIDNTSKSSKTSVKTDVSSSGSNESKERFNAHSTRYSNVLFKGIKNDITIEFNSADSLNFKTDQGELTHRFDENYWITPSETGPLNLIVTRTVNGNEINWNSMSFRVQNLPSPIIKFNGFKTKRTLTLIDLNELTEFKCSQAAHFEYLIEYEVLSLSMKLLRGETVIAAWNQIGPVPSEQTKMSLQKAKSGDLLLIEQCKVSQNGQDQILNPLIYPIE